MWLMPWRPYKTILCQYLRQTEKIELAVKFKIVSILYICNTAHFSLILLKFYKQIGKLSARHM